MSFPDQNYINHIREALWKRHPKASVMVGAGFSRNAKKQPSDARRMPTWVDMAKAMSYKLQTSLDKKDLYFSTTVPSETSGFLRLAQEYEAAFGRSELHKFIVQQIEDDTFKPGEMHSRLLRLPWRDVFTTNWDTLLERACPSVVERAYSLVRNIDEIPIAESFRIIKLHGSVSAHFPLVFTEEDYRTYPTKFSPFVNTVQQAMMETAFFLIGFSGNDPNFLHWSGWIRDNLGKSAPKIYLAGWLGLSPYQRRMLEDRNVIPIDLALHPQSDKWPEHLRDQYATQWILRTLEYGCSYDIVNWPRPSKNRSVLLDNHDLEPIERVVSKEPKPEPDAPLDYVDGLEQDLPVDVLELIQIWNHNRKLYPGWLSAPTGKQFKLSSNTRGWERVILKELPNLEAVNQLNALHELTWRQEILLEPITSKFEVAAEGVLAKFDCRNRTIDNIERPEVGWDAIRGAWRMVGLTLVTSARQDLNQALFEQRIESLKDFENDYPDIKHRIHHERCLWAVSSLDYEALERLLNEWKFDICDDPIWMTRKSALLCELGNYESARQLAKTSIARIRENFTESNSVVWASREGWALYLANACDWSDSLLSESSDDSFDMSNSFNRQAELATLKCDALSEKNHYIQKMRDRNKNEQAPQNFDLEAGINQRVTFQLADYNSRLSAYRAIRLSEIAGLPPSARHVIVASDILKLAADILSAHDPELAARLILRCVNSNKDDKLREVFSRTRIAAMDEDSAKRLTRICTRTIEFILPRLVTTFGSSQYGFWIERLRVVMEALSRFVLRADPEMCEKVFCEALNWYKNGNVAQHFWLKDPIENVLKRSWENLPDAKKIRQVFNLLNAPILGIGDFTTGVEGYPEPGHLLSREFTPPARAASNDNHWREAVKYIVRALSEGGEARKRASIRMSWVAIQGFLTKNEESDVAQVLWGDDYSSHNHLPSDTGLYDWAFHILPEPESGLAERRFREKWLKTESKFEENLDSIDDVLWNVGSAIDNLKVYRVSFSLSDVEQEYLAEAINLWAESPIPQQILITKTDPVAYALSNSEIERVRHTILGLQSILLEVPIAEADANKLFEKLQNLKECRLRFFNLTVGLIKILPKRIDEIVSLLRMGLASDEDQEAVDALWGLRFWLKISMISDARISPPPDDLVREVGIIIATRRKASLSTALAFARWIFSKGSQEQTNVLSDLVLQGLGYLIAELKYEKSHELDIDVPLLRWRCSHLAFAMAERGFGSDPTIISWMESTKDDPLPEVRYAKHVAIFRKEKKS